VVDVPLLERTVRMALKVPSEPKTWVTVCPDAVCPSPNCQSYVRLPPDGSLPLAVKVVTVAAIRTPPEGETLKLPVGACAALGPAGPALLPSLPPHADNPAASIVTRARTLNSMRTLLSFSMTACGSSSVC
jgi:hypothetical protein